MRKIIADMRGGAEARPIKNYGLFHFVNMHFRHGDPTCATEGWKPGWRKLHAAWKDAVKYWMETDQPITGNANFRSDTTFRTAYVDVRDALFPIHEQSKERADNEA